MRLIIIDDQVSVQKNIKYVLEELEGIVDFKMICCNKHGEPTDFPRGENDWYFAKSEEELYTLFKETLGIWKDDRFLIDVTLFEESQMKNKFTEYLSVKLADYIEKQNGDNVCIKFYTRPYVLSATDFARETKKWGKPIYRPDFEEDSLEEEAKNHFVNLVKGYCHVQ